MNRRLVAQVLSVLMLGATPVAVSAAPASAGCEGYVNKKWAHARFVSPAAAWHFYADNRKNPEKVNINVTKSVSRTDTTGHTFSGSVSTSVKAGLKFLAESKVDATFGASRSVQKTVTGVTQVGWDLPIPAYTEAAWNFGFYKVTAFKSRTYVDYQCRPHEVYTAKQSWPVYAGWKYTKLSYHK